MNKLLTSIILILLILGGVWWFMSKEEVPASVAMPEVGEAEVVGLNFMQDFVKISPPSSDEEAKDRVYNSLSTSAKQFVSRENIVADMAQFVGVQDVPDQGVSVEDMQVMEDNSVILILGLNYSSGRVLKAVNLVNEEGAWKVGVVIPVVEQEEGSQETSQTEQPISEEDNSTGTEGEGVE